MEYWYTLPYSADTADLQLAAGDAVVRLLPPAEDVPRPVLRWYTMQPSALILGAGQKPAQFDLDACRREGVALHKRSSGGTAVLAEPDQMMLDIALPRGHHLFRNDVTESYRWLGEVWVAALARLGITTHLITTPAARADTQALDRLTRLSCYGGRSPYEVLADGRKLVGLAQVRRRHGALLQTGIYTRWLPRRLTDLLALSPAERDILATRLSRRVVGLSEVLPDTSMPLLPSVRQAFAAALREQHAVTLVHTPWNDAVLAERDGLLARYAALALD